MKGLWRTLRRMATENLRLKLFSVATSLAIFFFVRVEQTETVALEVPVRVVIDPALAVTNDYAPTVRVQLRGPSLTMRGIDVDDIGPIVMDLSKHREGTVIRQLTTASVPL